MLTGKRAKDYKSDNQTEISSVWPELWTYKSNSSSAIIHFYRNDQDGELDSNHVVCTVISWLIAKVGWRVVEEMPSVLEEARAWEVGEEMNLVRGLRLFLREFWRMKRWISSNVFDVLFIDDWSMLKHFRSVWIHILLELLLGLTKVST